MNKISARLVDVCAFAMLLLGRLNAQVNVTTQHNDISRTGQNTSEVILTPQNVSSPAFGKLFAVPVDGAIFAQPLYLSGVSVPGFGTHNLVFVATEHASVYAIDADSPMAPLWQASLLDQAHGAAPGALPELSSDTGCTNIYPEYGVTSTPVIDPSTGTFYVVSVSSENGYPVQRLHALDVKTGLEKLNGPVVIQATVAGTGNGSSGGLLSFDPKWQLQRAGLLLLNNNVYIAFGSHCDFGAYHGWILAYNAATLAQSAAVLTSPNGGGGGIWMAGAGLAADTTGTYPRLFIPTGNGSFNATLPYGTNTMDYGDSVLQLTVNNGLNISDSFTPYNQAALSAFDGDVSSGGVLILPDQAGPYKHLAVQLGKSGSIYVLNRDNLGGFNTGGNNIVQEVDNQVTGMWGIPAYWNGNLYFWTASLTMADFTIASGTLSSSPLFRSSQPSTSPGISPSVSSNGNSNAIVWAIDTSNNPEVLDAFDALNVGNVLYSSSSNPARDSAGFATRYSVPTIANGKVYVPASGSVSVYGLLPPADFTLTASPSSVSVVQGSNAAASLTVNALNGFSGSPTFSASGLPSGVTASFSAGVTPSLTLTVSAAAAIGTYSISITGTSGTVSHSIAISLNVLSGAQPDFALIASPAAINTVPSSITSNGIILQQFNGFSASPIFTVAGLPAGVTASFSAASSVYYVMNLTAASTVSLGTSSLTVTATTGSLVRTVTFTLTVSANQNYTSVEIQAYNTSKCLQAVGSSLSSGASIVQSTCTGAPGQLWNLNSLGSGNYELVSANSSLALSILNGSYSPGALAVQNPYSAAPSQQWMLKGTPWGFYYVANVNSNQCLDVPGASTADGVPVDQAGCIGSANQLWTIAPHPAITQVSLSQYFTINGLVTNGTPPINGGLGSGYSLSTSNLGTSLSWNGSNFNFGPPNTLNATSGSLVALPLGQYSTLQLLALAVYGNQPSQTFQVTYTDGSRANFQQSFSDWRSPQNYPGESIAAALSYRIAPDGSQSAGPWYLYGYSLPLDNTKTVMTVQLPPDVNVFVFAIDVAN